ncbi:hypothetical protein QK290_17610, partial [Pseudarthrobacter sp. AL07]|uniref:hypothetical protein n=1 Tax=unclassified Pseudarthrobacter TaxID=2647000 RepID=UPI00249A91EA
LEPPNRTVKKPPNRINSHSFPQKDAPFAAARPELRDSQINLFLKSFVFKNLSAAESERRPGLLVQLPASCSRVLGSQQIVRCFL